MALDKGSSDGTIRCIYNVAFTVAGQKQDYYLELTDAEVRELRNKFETVETVGAVTNRWIAKVERREEIALEDLYALLRGWSQERIQQLHDLVVEI